MTWKLQQIMPTSESAKLIKMYMRQIKAVTAEIGQKGNGGGWVNTYHLSIMKPLAGFQYRSK